MSDKYFQNVNTNEFVTVPEGDDTSLYQSELVEETTNKLWREVSAKQAGALSEEPVEEPTPAPEEPAQ